MYHLNTFFQLGLELLIPALERLPDVRNLRWQVEDVKVCKVAGGQASQRYREEVGVKENGGYIAKWATDSQ